LFRLQCYFPFNPSLLGLDAQFLQTLLISLSLRFHSIKPGGGNFLLLLSSTHSRIIRLLSKYVWDGFEMSWDHVYRFVQRIPRGRVLTYGGLAKILRLPGGARAAGHAMAATPSGKGIPWHRVLGERGKILIREPYASLQRKVLESEGVTMVGVRVDLERHLWRPPRKAAVKQKAPRKRIQK
jgi:methylated-DNA-protein-cysteine methyltransferase-like protein